jgi:hypothetical protein
MDKCIKAIDEVLVNVPRENRGNICDMLVMYIQDYKKKLESVVVSKPKATNHAITAKRIRSVLADWDVEVVTEEIEYIQEQLEEMDATIMSAQEIDNCIRELYEGIEGDRCCG